MNVVYDVVWIRVECTFASVWGVHMCVVCVNVCCVVGCVLRMWYVVMSVVCICMWYVYVCHECICGLRLRVVFICGMCVVFMYLCVPYGYVVCVCNMYLCTGCICL